MRVVKLISKHKIIIIYWTTFIAICCISYILNVSYYISKKVVSVYLISGVFISFKYKVTIFRRGKFSDSVDSYDNTSVFCNILTIFFSLYVFFY